MWLYWLMVSNSSKAKFKQTCDISLKYSMQTFVKRKDIALVILLFQLTFIFTNNFVQSFIPSSQESELAITLL